MRFLIPTVTNVFPRYFFRRARNVAGIFFVLLFSSVLFAAGEHASHTSINASGLAKAPVAEMAAQPLDEKADETVDETSADTRADASRPVVGYPAPSAEQQQAAFPDMGSMDMAGHMGSPYFGMLRVNRFEVQDADTHTALVWDASASWGRDFDKVTVSSEGEQLAGVIEQVRTELFWRHALSRWWDSTLGLRQDNGSGSDRHWAGLGVQGLAPYFIEINATAYAGTSGRSALRLEAEYDMRFTDRLILQPRIELNAYGKADAETFVGKGVSDTAAGLRLRYEVRREIAPYLGAEWSRKYGTTADLARAAGERAGDARLLAGIRLWY